MPTLPGQLVRVREACLVAPESAGVVKQQSRLFAADYRDYRAHQEEKRVPWVNLGMKQQTRLFAANYRAYQEEKHVPWVGWQKKSFEAILSTLLRA